MSTIAWNESAAAHLYRRAGFGATAEELSVAVRDGLQKTVDRLVNYEVITNDLLESRIAGMHFDLNPVSTPSYTDMVRWWLIRMIYTARPFEERMTFFWHNHFATSVEKVGLSDLMRAQTDLFRSNAVGNFIPLCIEVAKDRAMQFWLDNWSSDKDHPNENFGRELLELFTLGRGHYSETDVSASARAFTGWTLGFTTFPVTYVYDDEKHDHGLKTFLGQTGDWNGDQIVRFACSQFDHGRWMASKLFAYFAYDNPEQEVVDRFARIYMDSGTNLKPMLIAILTSEEMYSPRAIGTRVKSPVEHVAMACHMLQLFDEVPHSYDRLMEQGQLLYSPPDVSGWKGGLTWVTSAALLSRMNFANDAVALFDPIRFGIPSAADAAVDVYLQRLGPLQVDGATRQALIDYVAPGGVLPRDWALIVRLRGLAHMILSIPEWQMI